MSQPKPFIKKFKTRCNYYAYDVNTNLIVKLDEITYDLLDWFPFSSKQEIVEEFSHKFPPVQIKQGTAKLEALAEQLGAFRPLQVRSRMRSPEFIRENVHKMIGHFEHLILSVSEQCNMRCAYCAYSGGYVNIRVHNNSYMSWNVARKAIDYFLANLGSQVGPQEIGFFGGEPLINFGLIRQCVEYTKSRNPNVGFGLTTNGTLLTDEITDFLSKNGIRILVSLDGPKEIHDVDRIFVSGKGTFDKIIQNLKRLKENHPEYYSKKVRFWCTLSPFSDYQKVFNFFVSNTDLFLSPEKVGFGTITDGHEGYFSSRTADVIKRSLESRRKLYQLFREKLIKGETGDREFGFLQTLFEKPYFNLHKRPINLDGWGEEYHFMTACFPGHYRLFVNADGAFQICEKSNDALIIGHIDSGLDIERIVNIYQKYHDLHNNECRSCWVHRFCKNCYVSSTCKTGNFEPTLDPQFCDNQRRFFETLLIDYCSILEENPHAFDYMNDIRSVGALIPVLQIPAD